MRTLPPEGGTTNASSHRIRARNDLCRHYKNKQLLLLLARCAWQAFRVDPDFELAAAARVHEGQLQTAVWFGNDLCGDRAGDDFVSYGKHNTIARDSQGTIKNDPISFTVVALRIFIGLVDPQPILAGRGHRAC